MSIKYKYADFDGEEFLTVFAPSGEVLVASADSHSNFAELVEKAKAGDESVVDLFDVGRAVVKAFDNVVEGRVAVRDGRVYFDDDEQDNSITKAILRFLAEGSPIAPLVKFMENVMANPQVESREQFYRWIEVHDFPIDDDGHIVAFKGVKGTEGAYTSISAGTAFVNGVEHTGYIPNAVGDVVTMPRSEVQHDPTVACHKGLHAGTWEYASDFARGAVMHVRINPRDVVSVPHDCTSQKVRVCRYEVIGFAETGYDKAYWPTESLVVDEGHDDHVGEEPEVNWVPVTRDNAVKGITVRRSTKRATSTSGRSMDADTDYTMGDTDLHYGWAYVTDAPVSGGGVWFSELVTPEPVSTVRDTRDNHKFQKRDSKGHFIKM